MIVPEILGFNVAKLLDIALTVSYARRSLDVTVASR